MARIRMGCPGIRRLILDIEDYLYVTIGVGNYQRVACWDSMIAFWRPFDAARTGISGVGYVNSEP